MVATIIISILTVATIGICTGATFAVINSVRSDTDASATAEQIAALNMRFWNKRQAARRQAVANNALATLLTYRRLAEKSPARY